MNPTNPCANEAIANVDAIVPDATECAEPRRGFLIRAATAALAVPAMTLAGAGHPTKKVKKGGIVTSGGQGFVGGSSPTASNRTSNAKGGSLPNLYNGSNARNFKDIMADEDAHVQFLVDALGNAARPKPNFQGLEMSNMSHVAWTARNFENTGVAAYLGALPLLVGSAYLQPAATIALIEARHSGYLNVLVNLAVNENIAGLMSSFEGPLTPDQVVSNISSFVVDLNGGPPLIPSGGLSNPIDVLNFALALEYLEAEFYNINVPKFFG